MRKKKPSQTDDYMMRIAGFGEAADDPIPHTSVLLRSIVKALLKRVSRHDDKAGKWCRMVIQGLAAQERSLHPIDTNIMRLEMYNIELMELEGHSNWKAHAPGHLHSLVLLQWEHLQRYWARERDRPATNNVVDWVTQHRARLYEELSFWPCICSYPTSLDDINLTIVDSESVVKKKILAELHGCADIRSIEPLLKPSYRSTPPTTYLK